jgi:hypothetical protein
MSSRSFSRSGTSVSVCEPHSVSTNATTSGFNGSLMSMTWTPSSPAAIGQSPQCEPPAGVAEFHDRMMRFSQMMVAEFHDRMMRFSQMMTSPWFPWVFVRLAQSSQLTISFGFAGAEMSIRRKPA